MSKLKTTFENVCTGAGAIAGARVPLFQNPIQRTLAPKKQKRLKSSRRLKLRESLGLDNITTASLKDLLRSKQRDKELRDSTEVFALEDGDGAIVKVYVKRDQADDFKKTIENLLADEEVADKELAEVLYDLHQQFDIVSVEWGEGAIPEDEEKVENSVDAQAKGFPDTDELGDVEAETQGTPDESSAAAADLDQGDGDADLDIDVEGDSASVPDLDGATDQASLLTQIVGLLKAQVDAQRAQADADKAKADVEAAEAAARAAAQYSTYQEEVMDMENYNKRKQEERRENQIQSKLIRYRHDLRKDSSKSLEDKLNDPEHLLNTLHKISIGESMKFTPATPEEEEILHMEEWEKQEKEKKQQQQLRDRLNRYRHSKRKQPAGAGQQAEPAERPARSDEGGSGQQRKSGSLMDYILRDRR